MSPYMAHFIDQSIWFNFIMSATFLSTLILLILFVWPTRIWMSFDIQGCNLVLLVQAVTDPS